MKLKKALVLTTMTAAIAGMNMFTVLADEPAAEDQVKETVINTEQETLKTGWDGNGSTWRYYDANGNLVSGWVKADGGDGRGNEVWYYIDPATQIMVYNETRVIDGVSYSFGEDGAWVAPTVTAPKGKFSGSVFTNTWSNIKIPFIPNDIVDKEHDAEDQFAGSDYAAIGSPKLTHDLYASYESGDLEIYYLDMKNKPEMDAVAFATEMGNIAKGKKGTASAVETATVGNQQYSKVVITTPRKKGAELSTYYCRKQDGYMVVIYTNVIDSDAAAMESNLSTITTAQ